MGIFNRRQYGIDRILFNVLGYFILGTFALMCFLPFVMVISGSFTDETTIMKEGFSLIPKVFSTTAYTLVFKIPEAIFKAYEVTIFITVVGTCLGLFLMSMTAYVLQRKDFPWRNAFSFYFFFTTLFSGGLVPWYILMVKYLNLKNTYIALIIPLLFNVFYIIILKSFISSIPIAITESAKIDGAGDFKIFIRLILPLSKPALASIGLFVALGYWNDWYNCMLFVEKSEMFPLQYYLYKIISSFEALNSLGKSTNSALTTLPSESFKMAMTVVAIGPIIFLYPWIQKYFVKGLTIGSVKG